MKARLKYVILQKKILVYSRNFQFCPEFSRKTRKCARSNIPVMSRVAIGDNWQSIFFLENRFHPDRGLTTCLRATTPSRILNSKVDSNGMFNNSENVTFGYVFLKNRFLKSFA